MASTPTEKDEMESAVDSSSLQPAQKDPKPTTDLTRPSHLPKLSSTPSASAFGDSDNSGQGSGTDKGTTITNTNYTKLNPTETLIETAANTTAGLVRHQPHRRLEGLLRAISGKYATMLPTNPTPGNPQMNVGRRPCQPFHRECFYVTGTPTYSLVFDQQARALPRYPTFGWEGFRETNKCWLKRSHESFISWFLTATSPNSFTINFQSSIDDARALRRRYSWSSVNP